MDYIPAKEPDQSGGSIHNQTNLAILAKRGTPKVLLPQKEATMESVQALTCTK